MGPVEALQKLFDTMEMEFGEKPYKIVVSPLLLRKIAFKITGRLEHCKSMIYMHGGDKIEITSEEMTVTTEIVLRKEKTNA